MSEYIDALNETANGLRKKLVQEADPRRWDVRDLDELSDVENAALMQRKKHALATANLLAKIAAVVELDSVGGGKNRTAPGMVNTLYGSFDPELAAEIERARQESEAIMKRLRGEDGKVNTAFSYDTSSRRVN